MEPAERNRIDVWLKLVCLVKHRADATEACKGGHVKINGVRVKPASPVREGDTVEFYSGTTYRKVVVRGLPVNNVSKEVARTLYEDQTPVQPKIEVPMARERGAGRPTKKERREIEKWRK